MMNTQILIYSTIFLTAILGLVLGIVALSFREIIKKYYALKDEYEKTLKDQKAKEEASTLEAKKLAERIITEAQSKAQLIINEASTFSTKSKEDFAIEVKKATTSQLENFQAALDVAGKEAGLAFGSISEDVRGEINQQMEALRSALGQEITRSQSEAKKLIEEAYEKVEVEVDAYRQIRQRQIDERIFEILETIITNVAGKALKLDEHEELVIEALEEAKSQNVL